MGTNGKCALIVLDISERHMTPRLHRSECAHWLWKVLTVASSCEYICVSHRSEDGNFNRYVSQFNKVTTRLHSIITTQRTDRKLHALIVDSATSAGRWICYQ
jgi:hypothetical protein